TKRTIPSPFTKEYRGYLFCEEEPNNLLKNFFALFRVNLIQKHLIILTRKNIMLAALMSGTGTHPFVALLVLSFIRITWPRLFQGSPSRLGVVLANDLKTLSNRTSSMLYAVLVYSVYVIEFFYSVYSVYSLLDNIKLKLIFIIISILIS
ncbi:hypothetical protein ACJX0J_005390, partial [Zea mays]